MLADVLLLLAALTAMFVGYLVWVLSYFMMWEDCPGYDDEGTVAAPTSLQGRLMCTDEGVRGHYFALALMILLLVLALVVWLRRRSVAITLILLAVMCLVPVPVAMLLQSLPDECTSSQWDTYGDKGCETDLES
ncbi:hypothetical protein ASG90_19875 [Nocardioides sp. Soil797]|nr:hypothetical protein ASG90_19875 [Nocardioides sp. Soil797]